MEFKETSSNFKFVSLNLLMNFSNYSEQSLKILKTHCDLLLVILKDPTEDISIKILSL